MTSRRDEFQVNIADWEQHQAALLKIRYQVFVVEQRVPDEEEWDGQDATALHALASDKEGSPIGTGRLLPDGKIGRMAVLTAWRNRGVGGHILEMLVDEAQRLGHTRVELSAQLLAIPFYQRYDFTPLGKRYMDAGIPHRMMARNLASDR